jgi:hypothetical protein
MNVASAATPYRRGCELFYKDATAYAKIWQWSSQAHRRVSGSPLQKD